MDLNLISAAVFFAVSFVAAAINSVAGGGTFLTFPVFILNGLTSAQANIMSTIALWPGVLASGYGYRSEFGTQKKLLLPFLLIGTVFGGVGAVLFLYTPETTFKQLVPWLLLTATLIFTFGKHLVAHLHGNNMSPSTRKIFALLLQVVISIYGGYFGAGMGILVLAMFQILGFTHIHQMNALKTLLTGAINAVTALIFVVSGKVLWSLAVVMMSGAILGGYAGARLALKVSPARVRMFISFIGFSMTAYFFIHGA